MATELGSGLPSWSGVVGRLMLAWDVRRGGGMEGRRPAVQVLCRAQMLLVPVHLPIWSVGPFLGVGSERFVVHAARIERNGTVMQGTVMHCLTLELCASTGLDWLGQARRIIQWVLMRGSYIRCSIVQEQ